MLPNQIELDKQRLFFDFGLIWPKNTQKTPLNEENCQNQTV